MLKNKIIIFLKNYWILILFILIFTIFILPTCFQNNDNINVLLAEHVDSGSILNSILQLKDNSKINSFYNQNIPYHTLYGFAYNSFIFWCFLILEHLFRINIVDNFYIYPLIAKLFNFTFTILSIIIIYNISRKILKYSFSKIIFLSLFLIFPQFLHYTFHIKSDILGLLFSIISFNYLFNFLQNSKDNKNIIKANIFGGLAVLCKQPHIFIIFPLFIGFISSLKGNYKDRFTRFIKIYLYSGIIFLLLFFFIHPYAFIETKAFLIKEKSLLVMTATSYTDNINYWIRAYIGDPLLFITAFTPFIFLPLYLFKKFRNIKTKFLLLISIYLITYLIWLTIKVGPIRVIHYLIPVVPFSVLIFSYLFDYSFNKLFISKSKIIKIFFSIITIIFLLFSIKIINNTIIQVENTLKLAYDFKKTEMYKSTNIFESKFISNQLNNKSLIFSVSLPINNVLYQKSANTWQFPNENDVKNYKPDYLLIDFTVSWEKPYEYWNSIAKQNKLNKEMLFIDNLSKEKNIVLFYK